MATVKVSDASFKADVIESEKPVLVDFWAEWCGPCKMIGPVIEELATDFEGKVTVGKMNVDSNKDIPMKYGVRSIPTILILKNGELVDKHVGVTSKQALADKINAHL
jgi:thioredoxin 1